MSNFTKEQLEAAKAAKSPEELVTLAKDAGIELTQEQAENFLKQGELADEELENVAGGACNPTIPKLTFEELARADGHPYKVGGDPSRGVYGLYMCKKCRTADSTYAMMWQTQKLEDGVHVKYENGKCYHCNHVFDFSQMIF
jgi:predicted ribosomally synthesized peptide with nif11-like leader